ncbi:hypothetical protein ACLH0K_01070 [Arthrobacter sp. MPF02]|uniref:hypothetical protein n=1 Tax=Arthrobacter sp. MPF02 TaxID=3388492 RepID=UPI003985449D
MSSSLPQAYELATLTSRLTGGLLTAEDASEAVQSLAYVLRDSIPESAGAGASIINSHGRSESAGATDMVVLRADDSPVPLAFDDYSVFVIERMNLSSQEAVDVLLSASRGESAPLHLHEIARNILHSATGG